MQVRITPARLKHPEIPFPTMLVRRAIPGTDLRVGDFYPDPGSDKRARLRAALYFEQRRIVPAAVTAPEPQPDAGADGKKDKEKKSHGLRKA